MNLELASYLRLRRIDELTWRQHLFLEPEDEVYFLREYTPRESFTYNDTNQFIFNFKKSPEKKETLEWRHKQRAISLAGSQLQTALLYSTDLNQRLSQATLVPIPPSAVKNSPQYDDRITEMLRAIEKGPRLDIRELVIQTVSNAPYHLGKNKRDPRELIKNYRLDSDLASPHPKELWIFDDILASGSHFKAMQLFLKQHFPNIPILGFFLARTIGKGPV